MEATQNPVDPDLFGQLQNDNEVQTQTRTVDPARAFIQKCLHPPSAVPGFLGIPTNDARSQVLLEWRNVKMQNQVYGIVAGIVANITPPPAEIAFLVPNALVNLCFSFYTNDGQTWNQDYNNNDVQDLYNTQNFHQDAQVFRPIYRSLTTYLNATMFNNTGFVTTYQFVPSILFAGTLDQFAAENPRHFIGFIKSTHKRNRYVRVDKTHPYFKFPKYIRTEIFEAIGANANPDAGFNIDPNTTIQLLNMGNVGNPAASFSVPSLSQTLQSSLRSYGGKAMDGTFAVQRLNTISPQWLTSGNTIDSDITTIPGFMYECYVFFFDNAGGNHYIPLSTNVPLGTTVGNIGNYTAADVLWSKDMTWSWVHYAGLAYNTNQSASTMPQLVIRKYYTGFEVQPSPASPWSGLIKLGPKPSVVLMQELMDKFYDLKDGMPARYNFIGTLLKGAGKMFLRGFTDQVAGPKEENVAEAKIIRENKDHTRKLDSLEKKLDALTVRNTNRNAGRSNRVQKQQQPRNARRSRSLPPLRRYAPPNGGYRNRPLPPIFVTPSRNSIRGGGPSRGRGNSRGRGRGRGQRVFFNG